MEEVAEEVVCPLVFAEVGDILQIIDFQAIKEPCVDLLPFSPNEAELVVHDEFQELFKDGAGGVVACFCDLIGNDWPLFIVELLH